MLGTPEVIMRSILILVCFLVLTPAWANDKVDFTVKPTSEETAVSSDATTKSRKPLKLPISPSQIQEIQEARDLRTGVKTEFKATKLGDAIAQLEMTRPNHSRAYYRELIAQRKRAEPKPFFKYNECSK